MRRFLKLTLVVCLALVGTGLLFRESLFNALFHYRDLQERPATGDRHTSIAQRPLMEKQTASDVEHCIDAALDATAEALAFTTGPAHSDADGALRTGKANCIGYAAVFQRLCTEQLARAGLSNHLRVHHMRGLLYCGTFNTHRLFTSPFWKDHDICLIEDRLSGERIHVDPALFDAFRIRRVRGPAN